MSLKHYLKRRIKTRYWKGRKILKFPSPERNKKHWFLGMVNYHIVGSPPLRNILERVKNCNIKLKLKKIQLRVPKVKYFRNTVSKEGLKPDPEKVKPIFVYPLPLFFTLTSKTPLQLLILLPSFFLTEWVIVPHFIYCFTWWYNRSTYAEPWHLNTRRTLLRVLHNKASSLLRSDT